MLADTGAKDSADMATAEVESAWVGEEHVELFSGWNRGSAGRLVRFCNRFNEFQLFRTLIGDEGCHSLSDVGCATGGFYRYVRKVWPSLEYKGFDVSEKAIGRAMSLYPKGRFHVTQGGVRSTQEIMSDVIFSRDVVHHQEDPCVFLSDLYAVAGKYLILRLRTRELGVTIFNVPQSCQYIYGRWVPYIVFNTSELIDLVLSLDPPPARLLVWRHPVVLGGFGSRYLPKELYEPEAGTAQTALLIEKGRAETNGDTVVAVETRPEYMGESRGCLARMLRRAARRVGI
jgi:SAM-dependent methyltransferase